ncbi:MAG: WecB/TagA/CpsF family glycosyltransferase [Anaerolineae bacterium]
MKAERASVLGVLIHPITYAGAVTQIIEAAQGRRVFRVAPLAVHGVIEAVLHPQYRHRLNQFDLAVPDGQPVRWALRWLHGFRLPDRVYGPTLMLTVCEQAAAQNLPIYLYGTTTQTIDALCERLRDQFPSLKIAGGAPSQFRGLSAEENTQMIESIKSSGARIVFVGLGCPRQEVWVYENADRLAMPTIAVGAAFDFLSGQKAQAPSWMQANGLEWLFRLLHEPARLWRRYLIYNSLYVLLLVLQLLHLKRFDTNGEPIEHEFRYG